MPIQQPIRIDAFFFFRYKFDDIFSVLESMIHSKNPEGSSYNYIH